MSDTEVYVFDGEQVYVFDAGVYVFDAEVNVCDDDIFMCDVEVYVFDGEVFVLDCSMHLSVRSICYGLQAHRFVGR